MNGMEFLKKHKFIAILRRLNPKYAVSVVKALYEGGVRIFEVTFDPSAADTCVVTQKIITEIKDLYGTEVMVGAGTVLYMDYARAAQKAGVEFLVSPCTDKDIIDFAKAHHILAMPGAYTPNEILNAYHLGADLVKIFPVAADEIGYLKNVLGPLSHIPFVPTGGVNPDTIKQFLDLGAAAIGAGASVFTAEMVENREFGRITERARQHVEQAMGS